MCIFDQLLGNGRRSLFKREGADVVEDGFCDPFIIETAVGKEPFVLGVDKRRDGVFWEFGKRHRLFKGDGGHVFNPSACVIIHFDGLFVEKELFGTQRFLVRYGEIVAYANQTGGEK